MIFIQPSINPVIMSLGFIDIRWYSLAYIFAFILGSIIIKKINPMRLNYSSVFFTIEFQMLSRDHYVSY